MTNRVLMGASILVIATVVVVMAAEATEVVAKEKGPTVGSGGRWCLATGLSKA